MPEQTQTSMAPSSSTSSISPTEKYPCPPEFNVLDFVPKLLSDRNYDKWKTLMRNFIQRQGLIGLIDDDKGEEEMANKDLQEARKRSESLVQGWILATLTEETRLQVLGLQTAKGLSDGLEKKFNLRRSRPNEDERGMRLKSLPLYKAIIQGNWDEATGIIQEDPDAARTAMNYFDETALAVAIKSARRNEFVGKLLEMMTSQDVEDLVTLVDRNGWTALHTAASYGNTEGVKLLVSKNGHLPNVYDGGGILPLEYAIINGHRDTVVYLMEVTRDDILLADDLGVEILGRLISSEFYDIALSLLARKTELASGKPSPLDRIVEKGSAFRSGNSFNFLQNLIYEGVPIKSESIAKHHNGGGRRRDLESAANCCISGLAMTRAKLFFVFRTVKERLHFMLWEVAEKLVPPVKCIRERKSINHDALELVKAICTEIAKVKYEQSQSQFWPALQNATRMGISEIVEQIIMSFPDAIYLSSVDDRYILQDAILERHEHLFNLIYQVDACALIIGRLDNSGNNGLHLDALLGHEQQINLKANVPVAALQMQRELQWFKEVEKLIPPSKREARNTDGMTPAELFSKTHQDLMKEGENWMKSTANSCTIVAALIATMVFAAAITVPGGINNENGHPLLSKQKAFIIFGIADSLALFSSLTSVLMFLLILTSRYAEEDFLRTLPCRLIVGLVTLFVSILSTMVASGAILYLIFGDNKAWILIPLVALAIIPTTLFGALQFPLLVEMIRSTYGQSIFGKQSDRVLR